jgi:hypothetical protein
MIDSRGAEPDRRGSAIRSLSVPDTLRIRMIYDIFLP